MNCRPCEKNTQYCLCTPRRQSRHLLSSHLVPLLPPESIVPSVFSILPCSNLPTAFAHLIPDTQMPPNASAFYLVRGEGVRDNEWHPSSPEPLTYSNLPSNQQFRLLTIPPHRKTTFPPVVRIYPAEATPNFLLFQNFSLSSQPNRLPTPTINHPTVTPPTAPTAILSASQSPNASHSAPRQHSFTGTSMIARPVTQLTTNAPSSSPPSQSSPPTSDHSSQTPRTRNLSKPKNRFSSQSKSRSAAASNAEQSAALKNVIDDIRDRRKRVACSKNMPPLPKSPEKPPLPFAQAISTETQQKQNPSIPEPSDRNTRLDDHIHEDATSRVQVKKELPVGAWRDSNMIGSSSDNKNRGSIGEREGGTEKQMRVSAAAQGRTSDTLSKKTNVSNEETHGQTMKLRKLDGDVTVLAPAKQAGAAVVATNGNRAVAGESSHIPVGTHKEGLNKSEPNRGEKVELVEPSLPQATKPKAGEKIKLVEPSLPQTNKPKAGEKIKLVEPSLPQTNKPKTGEKIRLVEPSLPQTNKPKAGEKIKLVEPSLPQTNKPKTGENIKLVEPSLPQTNKPKTGEKIKLVEPSSPQVNKKRTTAPLQTISSQGSLPSELRSESLGRFIRLLAHLVTLCNTQTAISPEKSKKVRNEIRSVVGLAPAISPSEAPLLGTKDQKERLSKHFEHQRASSEVDTEPSLKVDPVAQARSDLRGVRFKFLRWRMLISKGNPRLQEIATDCKQIANTCSALSKSDNDPSIPDAELLEYVSDLNVGSGTIKYLADKTKDYLQSIEENTGSQTEKLEDLKLATTALRDVSKWVLYLMEQVTALRKRSNELPKEEVLRFCTVMDGLLAASTTQARNGDYGIIYVLREIKKSLPTSRGSSTAGDDEDGKTFFQRRKKIVEDVASSLRALAHICTWAHNRLEKEKMKEKETKDVDREELRVHAETVRGSELDASKMASARRHSQKPSDDVARHGQKRINVQERSPRKEPRLPISNTGSRESIPRRPSPLSKGQGTGEIAGGNDSITKPSGVVGASEKNTPSAVKSQGKSPETYTIPRRNSKKHEEPKSTARPNLTRNGGSAAQAPAWSNNTRLDNAALVRARLSNGGLAGKRRRDDDQATHDARQIGLRTSTGHQNAYNSGAIEIDGDGHKKKKRKGPGVTFAPQLVDGSIETPLKKEELECVFHDGYDLLGCRNNLQQQAVAERANQLQRGAVVALFGYLRAEFLRLKHEAETGVREPTPELVDLRLTPSAVKQIERSISANQTARHPRDS